VSHACYYRFIQLNYFCKIYIIGDLDCQLIKPQMNPIVCETPWRRWRYWLCDLTKYDCMVAALRIRELRLCFGLKLDNAMTILWRYYDTLPGRTRFSIVIDRYRTIHKYWYCYHTSVSFFKEMPSVMLKQAHDQYHCNVIYVHRRRDSRNLLAVLLQFVIFQLQFQLKLCVFRYFSYSYSFS